MRAYCDAESNDRRSADRRQRRASFVVRERRSGFDRRVSGRSAIAGNCEGMLRGLRDRPHALLVVLGVVNVLNLADFLLTVRVLAMGGGEANPIMKSLFDIGPVYAGIFKLVAVLGVSLIVWRCRRFRSVLGSALAALSILSLVFVYHIVGLTLLT